MAVSSNKNSPFLLRKHLALMFFLGIVCAILYCMPMKESHRAWLFDRQNMSFDCDPAIGGKDSTAELLIDEDDINSFKRDGVVILRNIISKEWLRSYRHLLMHVHQNPSKWDVMYSRMLANFYGAQKALFLHQSSACGKRIGSDSPAATIAAKMFSAFSNLSNQNKTNDIRMRVIEPTEALVNYEDFFHTAWHRDDTYMNYLQIEEDENFIGNNDDKQKRDATVIRIWVPLMDMPIDSFQFLALNNSFSAQRARYEAGLKILGADFNMHESKLVHNPIISSQIFGQEGYRAGDVLVFAGDTPHFGQGLNCSSLACPRLIFSYALDGQAVYSSGKRTGLIPLFSGQNHGQPLQGAQFPLIYPKQETMGNMNNKHLLEPFSPTYGDVVLSLYYASVAGAVSFSGCDFQKFKGVFDRIYDAFQFNKWLLPDLDLETGIPTTSRMESFGT